MKKIVAFLCAAALVCAVCAGCSSSGSSAPRVEDQTGLAKGVYTVDFKTDSSMFGVNEAYGNAATLTVDDKGATVHVVLKSKNIVKLYLGTADEAKKKSDAALKPVTEKVTYSDGYTESVYAFDVPLSRLDTEFDLAILGTKDKWYDHKVEVSNPRPAAR